MASGFSDIIEEARLSAQALLEYGSNLFNPTVRLGVTGLSRAGKTVFITALIHGLLRGGRFPVFEPLSGGQHIEGCDRAPPIAIPYRQGDCAPWQFFLLCVRCSSSKTKR